MSAEEQLTSAAERVLRAVREGRYEDAGVALGVWRRAVDSALGTCSAGALEILEEAAGVIARARQSALRGRSQLIERRRKLPRPNPYAVAAPRARCWELEG